MRKIASVVTGMLVLAVLLVVLKTSVRVPGTEASKPYAAGADAVSVLIENQHPIPPREEWWVEHPSSEEIIAALIPPAQKTKGICVRRFWLPRDAKGWKAVDSSILQTVEKRAWGPHELALCAHYHTYRNDKGRAADLMKRAREWFWDDKKEATVYCTFRARHSLSKLFALDWIQWADASEFEKAFERVRTAVEAEEKVSAAGGTDFHQGSYWEATHPIGSAYFIEQLLAMCVCNVNPDGESNRWAMERLKHIGAPIDKDPQALYSTFELANVLNLLSRRGGGREYGQEERQPGFGGYEQYFAAGGVIQLEAVDTATNRKWNLRKRNLYFRTRQIGLLTEIDHTVANTKNSATGNAVISILARFFRDQPEIGGTYQWSLGKTPPPPDFREFQALAGEPPQSKTPAKSPLLGRIASRWHYRQDPSQPDSTFRMWITNRDLENFRLAPDERCLSFAIGDVGLVDGHANRCYVIGALANGVALVKRTKSGEPYIGTQEFWPLQSSHHPYWSDKRALSAEPVLKDPYYLVGTDGPVETDSKWRWTRDYTAQMTRLNDSGIVGKVDAAKMEMEFDPQQKRLEITDTIRADKSVYVGWHFSPTHPPKLAADGFEFGDGKNKIRVTVQGLDGTELEVKRRSQWAHDGYTLPLEWHEQVKGPKRIAENVGYTPSAYRDEYRVRVVIQANPQ